MQPVLFVCAAALLLQVLPGTTDAAVVRITTTNQYKFQIDHALVLTYSSAAQRDAILQRLFGLWKTVLAGYQVSNLSYKFLQEAPAIDPGTHVAQYEISGTSAVEVSLKEVTDSFEDALPNSGISEAATLSSLGGSAPQMVDGGKGMMTFNVNIQTFLSYRNSRERDAILQSILDLWKTTFASFQFTGLTISFISEESAGSTGAKKVTYRITGKSSQDIDGKSLTVQFLTALEAAQLDGVVGVQSLSSNSGMSSGSGSPVDISDSVIMTYKTSAERDSLLQKLMSMFITTLSSFQVTNLKIVFVREVVRSDGSKTVFYKLTGQAQQPLDDVQSTIEAVHTNLKTTPIRGITIVTGGDDSDSGSGTTEASDTPSDFEASTDSSMNSGSGMMSFRADLQTFLTYKSTTERDAILQQILTVWKTTFASLQLSDLKVTFTSEQSAGNSGAKKVSYRISGRSKRSVDVKSLIDQFFTALESAHVNGVAGVRSLSSTSSMSITGSGSPIEISDSLILNYKTTSDRDRLLQQILSLYKTSMSSFQVTNLKIEFVREVVGSDGSKTVFYKLTGQAQQPVDDQSTIEVVHTGLKTTPVSGITIVSGDMTGDMSATTDSSDNTDTSPAGSQVPVEINDSLMLKFKTTTERDRLLQQILSLYKTTLSSIHISSWKIQYVRDVAGSGGSRTVYYKITGQGDTPLPDVQSSIDQVHVNLNTKPIDGVLVVSGNSDSSASTTESSDQPSTDAAPEMTTGSDDNQGTPVEVSDSLLLTYSSTSQRDSLLQKILSLFKTRMTSLQWTNLKIQYIRDTPGTDGSKTVFYKITGQSQQPMTDVHSVIDTFHTSFSSSPIKGVSVISDSISSATESSDMTTDNSGGAGAEFSGGSPIEINDSLMLTFKSTAERDNLLQQILSRYQTTLSSVHAINWKIEYVRDVAGTGGSKTVFYKITGQGQNPVDDIQSTIDTVHSGLKTKPIKGVTIIIAGGSDDNSATTEGSDSSSSDSGAALEFTDSVMIMYKTSAERDRLLQQLLSFFKSNMQSTQFTNLKIQYISDVAGSKGFRTVTYKIFGQAQPAVQDTQAAIDQLHASLQTSPIKGILIVGASGESTDESSGESSSNGMGPVHHIIHSFFHGSPSKTNTKTKSTTPTPDSTDSGDDEQAAPTNAEPFQLEDVLLLTYRSTSERDSLLMQILTVFKTVMASVQFVNLKIEYVSDSAGSGGARLVTYRITGSAQPRLDAMSFYIERIHDSLTITRIRGISIPPAGGAKAPMTTSATTESSDQGGHVENSGSMSPGGPFDFTRKIYLAYDNPNDRPTYLSRLEVIWRNSLNDFVPTDVKIIFVSDKKVGKMPKEKQGQAVHEVTYRLTGSTQSAFDIEAVAKVFQQTVFDAHLGGVTFDTNGMLPDQK